MGGWGGWGWVEGGGWARWSECGFGSRGNAVDDELRGQRAQHRQHAAVEGLEGRGHRQRLAPCHLLARADERTDGAVEDRLHERTGVGRTRAVGAWGRVWRLAGAPVAGGGSDSGIEGDGAAAIANGSAAVTPGPCGAPNAL